MASTAFDLQSLEIEVADVQRNAATSALYEECIRRDAGATISDRGALIAYSGTKTGRSPADKRVVKHPDTAEDVWWGSVNIPIEDADTFFPEIDSEEWRETERTKGKHPDIEFVRLERIQHQSS